MKIETMYKIEPDDALILQREHAPTQHLHEIRRSAASRRTISTV